jgi:hypothetical protein
MPPDSRSLAHWEEEVKYERTAAERNDRMVLWAIRDMTGSSTLPTVPILCQGMQLHFMEESLPEITMAAEEALRLVTSLIANSVSKSRSHLSRSHWWAQTVPPRGLE